MKKNGRLFLTAVLFCLIFYAGVSAFSGHSLFVTKEIKAVFSGGVADAGENTGEKSGIEDTMAKSEGKIALTFDDEVIIGLSQYRIESSGDRCWSTAWTDRTWNHKKHGFSEHAGT